MLVSDNEQQSFYHKCRCYRANNKIKEKTEQNVGAMNIISITYLLTPLNLELLFTVVTVDWPLSGCCISDTSPCCSFPPNTDESLRRLLTDLVVTTELVSSMSNLWLLGLSSDFTLESSSMINTLLFLRSQVNRQILQLT